MRIDFTKMHGAGNDFVVIDDLSSELELSAKQIAYLCDRNRGIGADGVILVRPSRYSDCTAYMHYLNADGSLAEMCGNGARCFAKFLVDGGYVMPETLGAVALEDGLMGNAGTFIAETLAGKRPIGFVTGQTGLLATATVDMGIPVFTPGDIPTTLPPGVEQDLHTPFGTYQATCVNMGNPHVVIFASEFAAAPQSFNLAEVGGWIEQNTELFPEKVNVEFAAITGENHIIMRVYERGVGETLACGTGACAVAVAAALTGRSAREAKVALPGGILCIEWRESDDHVLMTGPATTVFEGTITL